MKDLTDYIDSSCGSEWSYIEFGSVCGISLCGTPFTIIDSEECAKDFLEYLKSFK